MQDNKSFLSFVAEFKMESPEKILRAALQLFFKYGIKHVTMDEIAKELGMSKKTIYQFYKEKDDLVNQLTEVILTEQEKLFIRLSVEAKDPIHEIILISKTMREMMRNINPLFFIDLQKFYGDAYLRFQKFKEDCAYTNIASNIKKGIELGYYRSDIKVEFVSRYRLAQLDLVMFGDFVKPEKMSLQEASELLLEMFVFGICTVKGHKLLNNYKKIKEEE